MYVVLVIGLVVAAVAVLGYFRAKAWEDRSGYVLAMTLAFIACLASAIVLTGRGWRP